MSQHCPICDRSNYIKIWSKNDFELYQFPFPPEIGNYSFKMDLNLFLCQYCFHGYLSPIPDDKTLTKFYENDLRSYTSPLQTDGLTKSMNEPAVKYISSEIKNHLSKKARVVEVGGFDGDILVSLKDLTESSLLIEPSAVGVSIGSNYGIEVLNEIFDERISNSLTNSFDVVISRHVIEHVPNPLAYLRNLVNMAVPDGMIIIETPDLGVILEQALVRAITLQHIHLFSLSSMNELVAQVDDLKVNLIGSTPSGFIITLSQNQRINSGEKTNQTVEETVIMQDYALSFEQRVEELKERINYILQRWKDSSKNIWIWGAGTAGFELFNTYGLKEEYFQGYIDSDKQKSQLRFANTPQLPICTPTSAYEMGVDAILIATFSVKEIYNYIRQNHWNIEVSDIYSCKVKKIK